MDKVLFIIPAYNEEENIANVIDEIRRDLGYVDILVVNDCSKDNTEQILKTKKVDYLNQPFNMGYSSALQSGFKYAVKHNYDYVVQFDGDGQHIAKEAEKLLNNMKETNVDIVIGSRFKDKTQYKHSFFRKIGTNLFRFVIKKSCKTEISDPTSGFQLLNREVFTRYAKMGNYPDYPDANLIIEMLFSGYKISEISVNMRERLFGESMHSGVLKPVKYMIKMFYSILLLLTMSHTLKDRGGKK